MTDAPNSVLTTGISSNDAPVTRPSGSSTIGISCPIAVPVTTPIRRPSSRGARSHRPRDAPLQPAHAADAVLDLVEPVVDLRRRQLDAGAEIQLVGAERPVDAALALARRPARASTRRDGGAAFLRRGLAHEVMLAVLGEADRHHRAAQDGGAELVQLAQRLLEHRPVVHARATSRPGCGTGCRARRTRAAAAGCPARSGFRRR